MKKEELKAYNKTWKYRITRSKCPDNWICGRPIRLFGVYLYTLWKVAKPEYKWDSPL